MAPRCSRCRRPTVGSPRALSIAGLCAIVLPFLVWPGHVRAQDSNARWRGSWRLSAEARYDSNVFRLTESQRASLAAGSGSSRFLDMKHVSDLVVEAGLRGSMRGRGMASHPITVGGSLEIDAYTYNTRLTHVALETFASQALTSRDKVTVELNYVPGEFRRNYLSGVEFSGLPTYAAGVSDRTRARLTYDRKLRRGDGPKMDLGLSVSGTRRSMAGLPWRNRTEIRGAAELAAELRKGVAVELRVERGRGAYEGSPEPFVDANVVRTIALNRDFDQTELGAAFGLARGKRTDLLLSYEHRIRAYVAALDQDPVFGDRRDDRDSFEVELRHDMHGPLEWRVGGRYRSQNTLRPARGDTADEADYGQTRVFVAVRYAR